MIFSYSFYSHDPSGKTDTMMKGQVGEFYIDVNGTKRPNKIGIDMFLFWLGDNGIVYPYGSKAVSEYTTDILEYTWKCNDSDFNCALSNSYGYGCTARVLEEGKMNY